MAGAVSRASLAEVDERFPQVLASTDAGVLGAELFEILHLLDREHGLRRTLSDPAVSGEAKAGLLGSLLDGKVSAAAASLAGEIVRRRWSTSAELTDAVEQYAVAALADAAERAGQLDQLEEDLFRFGRLIEGNTELRNALAGELVPADRKAELVTSLLEGKVGGPTLALVLEAVTHPRGRSLERGLDAFGKIVAARRNRLVALVRTAVSLTGEQQNRLAAALGASYGREVHLNIEIDPTVLGGIAVQLGDEAIDGTIAGRLDGVRRRIA
ncbi:F0F1 ATP synthase subunit delta [Actinocorallia sp. A-T 12471]|uniref:F0F1 ATP synthase subunit delta n=1 Tax=Actinocorallia sp. A-T 12471 TaxID=3089813 RepID=UPI0029CC2BE7|nr:F0F1 ATP synthase subunit delta [Actinocorallia sp. A-T 12471]MDX6743731.1 F0F1 ATP synthase subunit delta [Actinocorallia sp. A-T 12471]